MKQISLFLSSNDFKVLNDRGATLKSLSISHNQEHASHNNLKVFAVIYSIGYFYIGNLTQKIYSTINRGLKIFGKVG